MAVVTRRYRIILHLALFLKTYLAYPRLADYNDWQLGRYHRDYRSSRAEIRGMGKGDSY